MTQDDKSSIYFLSGMSIIFLFVFALVRLNSPSKETRKEIALEWIEEEVGRKHLKKYPSGDVVVLLNSFYQDKKLEVSFRTLLKSDICRPPIIECPTPVWPTPTCPKPICPTPKCPRPICPKAKCPELICKTEIKRQIKTL